MKKKAAETEFPKGRLTLVTILSVVGTAVSAYLTRHFYEVRSGMAGFKSVCNFSATMNCDAVAASPYAEFIFGLPVSSFAAGWFAAIAIATIAARDPFWRRDSLRIAFGLSAVAALGGLFYTLIMAAVLKTFCLFCLIGDGIGVVTFALIASLKPEGFGTHKPDAGKWKTLLGATAIALVASVVGMTALNPASSVGNVDKIADEILSTAPVSVNAGTEFPSFGPPDAPITIAEFVDFQCPNCRLGATVMKAVVNRYPGKVRVVLRNFPLDAACNRGMQGGGHPHACEAARAVLCAHRHGKFEGVYQTIFEKQSTLTSGTAAQIARDHGLEAQQVEQCMSSTELGAAISRDVEEGIQLGLRSTPTFFINGRRVEGAFPVAVWSRIIDRLLAAPK